MHQKSCGQIYMLSIYGKYTGMFLILREEKQALSLVGDNLYVIPNRPFSIC